MGYPLARPGDERGRYRLCTSCGKLKAIDEWGWTTRGSRLVPADVCANCRSVGDQSRARDVEAG